ncbi:BTAD domain-containing putative transcriptional regulator [Streptomyces sp. NPDC007264]|uniref:AfsR/SARP family transcriptional regulator n=1 Tax=Streptomyces sp. NPDC007264 TaxID=3364777 RepID=UPI0036DA1EE6
MDVDGVRFSVLGPTRAVRGGREIRLGGIRQRAVLAALLVARGRMVPAERIMADVWQGATPSATTLHAYVCELRRALEPERAARTPSRLLVREGPGYALRAAPAAVDAECFTELAVRGRRALDAGDPELADELLGRALDLWRGPAYADLADARFAVSETARLEDLRATAREDRLAAAIGLGRHAAVVGELRASVVEQPLRERGWELLALALYRSGRQADALAALRTVRQRLADELGIDPGPSLRDLESAVLAQDRRLDRPATTASAGCDARRTAPVPPERAARPRQTAEPGGNLPFALSGLVGRTADIATVEGLLEEYRLVTLAGPGGVGKTRLALETARRRTDHDGPWLVELAPLTTPELLPATVAAAMGIPGVSSVEQLTAALAGSELLLVLDNCEHLRGPAAALVSALLARCGGVRVLATSRETLDADGEAVYEVPPLDPAGDGRELFLRRAATTLPGWSPGAGDLDRITGVCAALDGIPLAIELAAAQCRMLSVGQIADAVRDHHDRLDHQERLDCLDGQALLDCQEGPDGLDGREGPHGHDGRDSRDSRDCRDCRDIRDIRHGPDRWDRFEVLAGGPVSGPERHRTIEGAVAWSHRLLESPERRLFHRLGVFAAGFDLDAAAAVGGLDPVLPSLSALVRKSLVAVEPGTAPRRYRMLETLRQYALRTVDPGELAGARGRHRAWALARAERCERLLHGPRAAEALARLSRDQPEFRAAFASASVAGDGAYALRLGGALYRFWYRTGQVAQGLSWMTGAFAAAPDADPAVRCRARLAVSGLNHLAGRPEQAYAAASLARREARRAGDQVLLAWSDIHRAHYGVLAGRPVDAAALARRAVASARATGQDWLVAEALTVRGIVARTVGDLPTAATVLSEAAAVAGSCGHDWAADCAASAAMRIACDQGDGHGALDIAAGVLAAPDRHHDVTARLLLCHTAARALALTGRADQGAVVLGAVRAIGRRAGFLPESTDPLDGPEEAAAVRDALSPDARARRAEEGGGLSLPELTDRLQDLLATCRVGGLPSSGCRERQVHTSRANHTQKRTAVRSVPLSPRW